MEHELINADFSRRVVVATDQLPWVASPQAGVERRLLDRVGGEVARATSLVRYAPGRAFPAHEHALGEEFLVLEGIFSDEYGHYPAGTYVRNPPGSRHAPRTGPGCTILVKLRQMAPVERQRVVVDTTAPGWVRGEIRGQWRLPLHSADREAEWVTMERLESGAMLPETNSPGGTEIFVLAGTLQDEHGVYGPGNWVRNPAGTRSALASTTSALYWAKRGHLPPAGTANHHDPS
ncbi:MAG TPA: cupin domain-containing protein [Burkholderiales bacterium]|jgi:anti-sigma factor ChrR (cupin superfamily)|nr:cupin domain-containing protein [Burkholderiales bacterium]